MRRSRRGRWCAPTAGALLIVTLGVAGCGPEQSGRAATDADLRGRSFLATDAAPHTFVRGAEVRIGFSDGAGPVPAGFMSSFGGCNAASGKYSISNGKLTRHAYSAPLVGCGAALEPPDQWLNGLLADAPDVRVRSSGEVLTLTTADEAVTFEVRPEGEPRASRKASPPE